MRVCILSPSICLRSPSALFTYIERSVASVVVALSGLRIRDNIRTLCRSARRNVEILTFLLDT